MNNHYVHSDGVLDVGKVQPKKVPLEWMNMLRMLKKNNSASETLIKLEEYGNKKEAELIESFEKVTTK